MSQTAGTLLSLFTYLSLVALGAALGARPSVRSRPPARLSQFQSAVLMLLIAALGVQLGVNKEVMASLGTIGLSALAITLSALGGSLLCVTLLRRFVLRLDRRGRPIRDAAVPSEDSTGHSARADNALTRMIVAALVLGMLAGRFLLPGAVTEHCGQAITLGLYLLLFLVGVDMGRQGTALRDIRAAGPQVLLVPLATAVGTLAAAALAGLLLPMGAKDAMAAAAGFGWYSLAPTLLAPYSLTVSATAFLANMMREILSILIIPLAARWVGHVECAALPGAAAMDTVLPVVVGTTSQRNTVYAFTSGVVLSLLVPVLVPAIAALPL